MPCLPPNYGCLPPTTTPPFFSTTTIPYCQVPHPPSCYRFFYCTTYAITLYTTSISANSPFLISGTFCVCSILHAILHFFCAILPKHGCAAPMHHLFTTPRTKLPSSPRDFLQCLPTQITCILTRPYQLYHPKHHYCFPPFSHHASSSVPHLQVNKNKNKNKNKNYFIETKLETLKQNNYS